MPMPVPIKRPSSPEEQLLEKINITQEAIKLQISHVASDIEVLYYCGVQSMLTSFAKIFTSEKW